MIKTHIFGHAILISVLLTATSHGWLNTPAVIAASIASDEHQNLEIEKLKLDTELLQQQVQGSRLKALNDWVSIVQSIATTLSILVGGWWIYSKFVRAQERYPNIEFTADIIPIGDQNDVVIVELIAYVENKGKAQHRMEGLDFDLNALFPQDALLPDRRWGGQINFPTALVAGSFLPAHNNFFFVDPGTSAKYSFITAVPHDASFLMLHCRFNYINRGKTGHTAERTIQLQSNTLRNSKA